VRVLTMLPLLTRELDKSSFGKTQRPVPDFRREFLSPLKNPYIPSAPAIGLTAKSRCSIIGGSPSRSFDHVGLRSNIKPSGDCTKFT